MISGEIRNSEFGIPNNCLCKKSGNNSAVRSPQSALGIYIHIPFCQSKCPYCDFYSVTDYCKLPKKDAYFSALVNEITTLNRAGKFVTPEIYGRPVDTVYFGGGTPSLFGGERLAALVSTIKTAFNVDSGAEITVECNPSSCDYKLFEDLAKAGVNRVSIGLQSAVPEEREVLGRLSGPGAVKSAIAGALAAGINNISLDLMLGVPGSNIESLKKSLGFCLSSGAKHISAYMLKIEEGTPFAKIYGQKSAEIGRDEADPCHLLPVTCNLPGEELVEEMYFLTCEELSRGGIEQYEISNFAVPGYESRHNLKYWSCREYLGLGPSAYSFINGRRFYFTRDLEDFIEKGKAVFDGEGGSFEEFAMLKLRLTEGMSERETLSRFGRGIPAEMRQKAEELQKYGLTIAEGGGLRLTRKGFLLSNTVIGKML